MQSALRCSICSQNIVGQYTSYNNGAVNLCRVCASGARGAFESCAAGCGTLVRVGERNVAVNASYNKGTVYLCASCNGGARGAFVWCAAGCGTLVRVGDRSVASCAAYNKGTVYLCGPCNGGARGALLRCAAGCGRLIRVGERNVAETTQNRYSLLYMCTICPATAIHCGVCNTPAADAQGHPFPGARAIGVEGPNSDYRCAFCAGRMVNEQTAQTLYNQVYTWLTGRQSGLGVSAQQFPRPPYTIRSRAELRGLSHLSNIPGENPVIPDLLGLCEATVRQDGSVATCNVDVERFLTQVVFLSVAAHELTHAWQYYLRFPQQTPQIREGFAEWVAVRFLRWLIAQPATTQDLRAEAQRRIDHLSNNTDPVYGAGLRNFLDRERQGGLPAVLARARQQA